VNPAAAPLSAAAVSGDELRSRAFRVERQGSWLELEGLLDRIEARGIAQLTAQELERFPVLHRFAVSSLSVARAISLDRALLEYLEHLALRSYLAVYTPPMRAGIAAWEFISQRLPQAVRALRWHLLVMAAVLVLGGVAGYVLVDRSEGLWYDTLVPASLAQGRGPLSTRQELQQVLSTGLPATRTVLAAIADVFFVHNTTIGLLMFGLGALAGIPCLLLGFYQGLILGAMLALHAHRGLALPFMGWVSVHGVTELGGLLLFGAAGLRLGELLVFPGAHSRVENYGLHGPTAGTVALGAAVMMLIAACLEGYVRQAILLTDARLAIAALTFMIWLGYFAASGRGSRAA
jgi:uncharacterized membrane protein SpoIIM required for sporulation